MGDNAMVSVFSPVRELTADDVRRVTEVTYLGVVHGTLAALRRMLPRDRGAIVQVGSALGYRGIPLQAAYCGAKHAVQGFTDSLRCELLHDNRGVRISMVQLPAMNTPQFDWVKSRLPREPQPVPPIYEPEIAADAIVWAASQRRREISVGGTTVAVIWANKFASGLIDRYLARTGYESQQTNQPGRPEPVRQFVGSASGRPRRAWTLFCSQHPRQPADMGEPAPAHRGRRGRRHRRGGDRNPSRTFRESV